MEDKGKTRLWPEKPYLDFSKAKPTTDPKALEQIAYARRRMDEMAAASDVMDRIERLRAEGKYPPAPRGANKT